MPRRTTNHYLTTHSRLKHVWLTSPYVLSYLNYTEQRDLHSYYLFALNLTEQELLSHRATITSNDPSIPQRAGPTLKKLDKHIAALAAERNRIQTLRAPSPLGKERNLVVGGLARPEPDIVNLAKAFINAVERLQ
jgi:hypothetical protein